MSCTRVDHVALWVEDPTPYAQFCTQHLGMHVIERSELFTLVGADARRGKLTFFCAEGARSWSPLAEISLHCSPSAAAGAATVLAPGRDGELDAGSGPEGMPVGLLVDGGGEDWDLARVSLLVERPIEAREGFSALGFQCDHGRLRLGETELVLEQRDDEPTLPTRLNHIAVLVDSAAAEGQRAAALGFEIDRTVDAANTRAVFVRGPEGVLVEYVEHKRTFSLT
jgi:catechol 2,3-dioxygenase-like lactoylglutathione lyase family enzyme